MEREIREVTARSFAAVHAVAPSDALEEIMNVGVPDKPARRLAGIPDRIQEYLLCLLFLYLLPVMPLVAEIAVLGYIERKTLLLFAAIHPLSLGVSSQNRLLFGLTIVVGLFYSLFFGLLVGGSHLPAHMYETAYLYLGIVMLWHAIERYDRHIAEGEAFWEFEKAAS